MITLFKYHTVIRRTFPVSRPRLASRKRTQCPKVWAFVVSIMTAIWILFNERHKSD